jgi:tetratricopeptide (TPR) repeat protein
MPRMTRVAADELDAGARVPVAMRQLLAALGLALALAAPLAAQNAADEGVRLFSSGRFNDARVQLAAAAKADPRNATAAFYLGRVEMAEGDGERAADWFERAARIDPASSQFQYWLGNAYGRQAVRAGRLKQARLAGRIRGALERAIELDPDNIDARSALLQSYVVAPGIMGGSMGRARAQAREIARRSPLRGRIANGAIAEREKDDAVAEREYDAAVTAAPDSAIGYTVLGDLYRRTGKYDQAFATFARMQKVLPQEASPLYLIGRTSAVSGERLDEGAAALRGYLAARRRDTDPPLASAHFRLATILEKQGRRDEARGEYQATLRLDPDQKEAREGLARVR